MEGHEQYIGQDIISVDSGLGRVVAVEKMNGTDSEFLVIEYMSDNSRAYYNIDGNRGFRPILSKSDFEKSLKEITEFDAKHDFKSKEERINYFKSEARVEDVNSLLKMLKLMLSFDDLSSAENLIVNRVQESLALELATIAQIDPEEAQDLILGKVK